MPNYPTSLDTPDSLFQATDVGTSTLVSAITAGQTSFDVTDGTVFPTGRFIVTVELEQMIIASRSGNTFNVEARGQFGTSAATHGAGVNVDLRVVAELHLEQNLAIIATQTENDGNLALSAYTFFWHWLVNHAPDNWSQAEVNAGLDPIIYRTAGDLPAVPTSPTIPNFAMVRGTGPALQLAYWNFLLGAGGSWQVTSVPWVNPFIPPHFIINQIASNGAGNNNWNFVMGNETHIIQACDITNMSVKLGTGAVGNAHNYDILRSTVTGATAPALTTYTDSLVTGTITTTAANTWENVTPFAPIPVAVDEWILCRVFPGAASGQSATIATLRTAGELTESHGVLNAGVFISVGGTFPGPGHPMPLPTSRIPTVIYGVTSLELTP
jgi:hypothetical protein